MERFGVCSSHYFINCLLLCFSITKTNYRIVIQKKFPFSSNKFQIYLFWFSSCTRSKNLYKIGEKFFFNQSGSAPVAQSIGKHTYIDSACVAQSLAKIPCFYPKTPCILGWSAKKNIPRILTKFDGVVGSLSETTQKKLEFPRWRSWRFPKNTIF